MEQALADYATVIKHVKASANYSSQSLSRTRFF
jgi:hypothetical protein